MLSTTISLLALAAGSLSHTVPQTSSGYKLDESYEGTSFFNGFDFFTGDDPTEGHIKYVDPDLAASEDLAGFLFYKETTRTHAYMGVNHVDQAPDGRNSVRLLSKKTFSPGMLTVVDVHHAPTGPSLWPAVWLLANDTTVTQQGQGWPNHGEIDIMEWINDRTYNAMTLHTVPGCSVDDKPESMIGTLQNPDCNFETGHKGCSVSAPSQIKYEDQRVATAGPAFNEQGGGVYVVEWTETGFKYWLFPRDNQPRDLEAGTPDPSTWSKPLANFGGSGCDYTTFFQNMQIIINIDVCGTWAADPAVWPNGPAQKTGYDNCSIFATEHPEAYKDAYFDFASVKVYLDGSRAKTAPPLPARVKRDEPHTAQFNYIDLQKRYETHETPEASIEPEGQDNPETTTPSSSMAGHGRPGHHKGHYAHTQLHSSKAQSQTPGVESVTLDSAQLAKGTSSASKIMALGANTESMTIDSSASPDATGTGAYTAASHKLLATGTGALQGNGSNVTTPKAPTAPTASSQSGASHTEAATYLLAAIGFLVFAAIL